MTKERLSTPEKKILGQDLTFYSAEEATLNEGRLELNAVELKDFNKLESWFIKLFKLLLSCYL
jgi:DNA-directed RNA polymerase subunit beta'